MTLGQIIKKYRKEHRMSMETFASRSGLSKATIGFLESGVNPKTKKTLTPTFETIVKCAKAMGIDARLLMMQLDDERIDYSEELFPNSNVSITATPDEHDMLADIQVLLDIQRTQQETIRTKLIDKFMNAPMNIQLAIAYMLDLKSIVPIIEDMHAGEE